MVPCHPGVQHAPIDGALEPLPGSDSSLRQTTRGSQVVVVETDRRPVVIAGGTAAFFAELDEPRAEGQG